MRRTMDASNWIIAKMVYSKMDWIGILTTLENARGNLESIQFKASDMGLKGSQLHWLMNYGVIRDIGTEEYYMQTDKGTIKCSVNVYTFDSDIACLLNKIKEIKHIMWLEEIEYHKYEIECHNEEIKELERRINSL